MPGARADAAARTTADKMHSDKAASDNPVFLTDNGHYILDCSFGSIADPALLHSQVNGIVGVMDNGLFIGMADLVVVGNKDGSTKTIRRPG
jgi:ribose 5-phosphate isomerase A